MKNDTYLHKFLQDNCLQPEELEVELDRYIRINGIYRGNSFYDNEEVLSKQLQTKGHISLSFSLLLS